MIKNIFYYLLGLIISSLGIVFFLKANVGVGTGDSVAIGLSIHFPITIGIGLICIHATVIIINSILTKSLPKITVIFPILIRGFTVDIWVYLLNDFHLENVVYRWALLALGLVLMGLGIGIYLISTMPKIPVDEFIVNLSKLNRLSFKTNRIIFELTLLVIGYSLGGPVGLGTIIIGIGLGPSIQYFHNLLVKATIKSS